MKKFNFIQLMSLVVLLGANFSINAMQSGSRKRARGQSQSDQGTRRARPEHRAGIKNHGNTCFFNASLQCLASLDSLQNFLIENENAYKVDSAATGYISVPRRYINLSKQLSADIPNRVINQNSLTNDIIRDIFKTTGRQQDAEEFITELFKRLETDLKFPQRSNTKRLKEHLKNLTFIEEEEKICCSECGHYSENGQEAGQDSKSDLFLRLEIPEQTETLENLIKNYFENSEISGYRCDGCQKTVNAHQEHKLKRLPDSLMIQLKRFKRQSNGSTSKVDTNIKFPLQDLDVTNYLTEDAKNLMGEKLYRYDLVGFIAHNGILSSGHYFAYVKHGDEWTCVNDERVSIGQRRTVEIISQTGNFVNFFEPYLFFYQLKEKSKDEAQTQQDATQEQQQTSQQNTGSNSNAQTNTQPNTQTSESTSLTYDVAAYERLRNHDKNLRGANLSGADLRGMDLTGVDFTQANLTNAKLNGVDPVQCKIIHGANFNGAELVGADLSYARLESCSLNKTMFIKTDLTGAFLNRAEMNGTVFIKNNLTRANFSGIQAVDSIFFDNNAEEINLTNISFKDSILFNMNMKRSRIDGFFLNATFLAQIEFNNASINNIFIKNNICLGMELNFENASINTGYILGKVISNFENTFNGEIKKSNEIEDCYKKAEKFVDKIKKICCKYFIDTIALNFHEKMLKVPKQPSSSLSRSFNWVKNRYNQLTRNSGVYCLFFDVVQHADMDTILSYVSNCKFNNAVLNHVYFSNVIFSNCEGLERINDSRATIFDNVLFTSKMNPANYLKSIGAKVVIKNCYSLHLIFNRILHETYDPAYAVFWKSHSNLEKEIADKLIAKFL
ncbi:pentapeptide repeat-containing protein [Candidatus Babeliales bacterium]|nr:pentapeptide repeat-containing protein [Candidatus Babeliales bacterium]